MYPGGPPASFGGTALTTPEPAKKLFDETPTTWTAIFEDFASKSPASTRPEMPEEVGRTEGGTIAESPFLVPLEDEEVYGEDIVTDTMEVAEFVTHKFTDGIVETFDVGDVDVVLEEIKDEHGLLEDDKILEITPEVVIPPEPNIIEEVTPHGEEPPSETVAEEVFTEAAVMVLVKPTVVYPTEAGMLEDVSLDPTIGQEVRETADNFFDISTNVEVSDAVEEKPTVTAEKTSDTPYLADVAVPADADEEIQVPPVELPSETPSGDKIEVGAEVSPTVFLMTSHNAVEAELEPVTEVEPLSNEDFALTFQDDMEDLTKPEIEEVLVTQVEMAGESDVNEPTVTVVLETATEELKEEHTAVVDEPLVDTEKERLTEETEEMIFTAEHATEPSHQFTTRAMTDDEAVRTVQGTTEVTVGIQESPAVTIRPLEIPAEPLPESTKDMELVTETANEAEQAEATEPQEEATIQPVEEADGVKEVDAEETQISETLPAPVEISEQNESDVDMTPLENTEVLTVEPLDKQEEAGTVEIITEDSGDSDLDKKETHAEVLDEGITETFNITTLAPDEMITPIIAVVPEHTDGFLPNTEVKKLPDHEVNMHLPEDSESDLQPGVTDGPSQIDVPIKQDYDSEDISRVEEENLQEIPDLVTQMAVTHPVTSTKIGAIEPDKVTQDVPPRDHVISIEESVLQQVEVFHPDAETKDAAETLTVAPVVATSESFVKSTSGNEQVTTEKAPEEPTTIAPAKPMTKYVVEYNNGNFPDITESPYFVDDNLLGNNGFELDEDENSVCILHIV